MLFAGSNCAAAEKYVIQRPPISSSAPGAVEERATIPDTLPRVTALRQDRPSAKGSLRFDRFRGPWGSARLLS